MDSTIKLLADLVAIDSVNPSLVPGGAGEQKIARAIAAEMRAIGLEVEVTDVAPGRPNVVGVLEGRAPGRSLMLCGHMDTVLLRSGIFVGSVRLTPVRGSIEVMKFCSPMSIEFR